MHGYELVKHQQVVAARARELRQLYRIQVNTKYPDSDIKDRFPDIIVMDRDNNILFIEEVETENSISKRQRDRLWIRYAHLGYAFNLIVPRSKIEEAIKLTNGLKINKLYYYELINVEIQFRHICK
jgi:hypothetical protein